jgi:hypothetical protein
VNVNSGEVVPANVSSEDKNLKLKYKDPGTRKGHVGMGVPALLKQISGYAGK